MSLEKPTRQDLKKLDKYPGYYFNPTSMIIYWRGRVRGKAVKLSTGKKTIKEAKSFIENRLIDLLSSNPEKSKREKRGISNALLSDLWVECIDERRASKGGTTLRTYQISWDHGIEEFWGNLTATDISDAKVKQYENWYLKENPTRDFFNTRKHLVMFFNYCHRQGYISRVPKITKLNLVINARMKKEKPGREYSPEEIERLKANADLRTKLGIMFARYMGMRKMEIVSLPIANINQKTWTAKVWSAKNKKWREIPMPDSVISTFKEYVTANNPQTFLFPGITNEGIHLTSQVFDRGWMKAKEAAKIPNWNKKNAVRFHDLRHSFATQTARDNWPPMMACEILDMSLVEYQRTYVHMSEADLRGIMMKSFGVKP